MYTKLTFSDELVVFILFFPDFYIFYNSLYLALIIMLSKFLRYIERVDPK